MEELSGKVAVVTGAASGIGFGLAERFAAEGMRLVIADVEAEALERAEKELGARGAEVLAVRTDVTDPAAVDALAQGAIDRFGTYHVVCNNAGVAGPPAVAWETSLETWQWVMGVNLWGVIHGVRSFTPRLIEQDEGHIVNTASSAGLIPLPFSGPYTATKHAVLGISRGLANELAMRGSKVRVSVLCPGFIRTNLADSERNWPSRLGPPPNEAPDPATEFLTNFMREGLASGKPPSELAALVVDAVRSGRFMVLTEQFLADFARSNLDAEIEGRDAILPGLG